MRQSSKFRNMFFSAVKYASPHKMHIASGDKTTMLLNNVCTSRS